MNPISVITNHLCCLIGLVARTGSSESSGVSRSGVETHCALLSASAAQTSKLNVEVQFLSLEQSLIGRGKSLQLGQPTVGAA